MAPRLSDKEFANLATRRQRHARREELDKLLRESEELMDVSIARWADRPDGWLADYSLSEALSRAREADTFNKARLGVRP